MIRNSCELMLTPKLFGGYKNNMKKSGGHGLVGEIEDEIRK